MGEYVWTTAVIGGKLKLQKNRNLIEELDALCEGQDRESYS